jgi:vacuolar-type H+-ATPase subunit H
MDFWKEAKDLGEKAIKSSEKLFNDAVGTASEKIQEFKHTLTEIVSKTEALRHEVQDEITKHNLTLEDISDRLSDELAIVFKELQTEFSEPLPENKTERYKCRETIVSSAMSKIEDAFVKVAAIWQMSEDKARTSFQTISPHIQKIVLITCKKKSVLVALPC